MKGHEPPQVVGCCMNFSLYEFFACRLPSFWRIESIVMAWKQQQAKPKHHKAKAL
jgi:hypothetical protein